MTENTIIANKFFREFCFSNYFIASYWLKAESFTVVEDYLSGNCEYIDEHYNFMKDLLLHKQSKTEIKALEHVISNLMNDLNACKFHLEMHNL